MSFYIYRLFLQICIISGSRFYGILGFRVSLTVSTELRFPVRNQRLPSALVAALISLMEACSVRRIVIYLASSLFFGVLVFLADTDAWKGNMGFKEEGNNTLSSTHRKLLHHRATATAEPNRMWGDKCSKSDIVIHQGPTAPLSSGIPTYTVEIMNLCVSGCNIAGIHLSCGWFSSARLINPKVFKRLRYNDCLVNDGKALMNGGTISFQYANTFLYPLSVSSVVCA